MSRLPNPGGPRNGSNGSAMSMPSSAAQFRPGVPSPQAQSTTMAVSRAERFEDEKRRIIESCFSKTDANGQLSESYITHIRIHEDADYPSSPPPPDSETKKPRLIIIAVRSTGRVRMHKARENTNGSFSIGKTWNLEELSAIESFSNSSAPPRDDKEAQYRSWAGSTGFVVTIAKPYYWQAGTSKEKDFFIASTVKIYRKYTKGLVPELKGFDERDQALMLGGPAGSQTPQKSQRAGSRAGSESPAPGPPQPPFAAADQSREGSRYRGSPGPPQSNGGSRVPSESSVRAPNSQPYRQVPPTGGPRQFASTDQMRAQTRESPAGESRPGTAPGPGQDRGAYNGSVYAPPPRPYVQTRSDSPALSTVSSGRESGQEQRRTRPHSPPRQRSQEAAVNSVSEDRQYQQPLASPPAGAAIGAALFATTRQRWMQQPQQAPSVEQRQPSPYQLPSLETTQPSRERSAATVDHVPFSPQSDNSSAGIEPGVAAAVGNLPSSFWPSERSSTPPQAATQLEEPSSPLTPERSRKRPPLSAQPSEASMDMRPPPLKQGARTSGDRDNNGLPRDAALAATSADGSTLAPPASEVPPVIKPPAVNNEPEPVLAMPGAFVPSPAGSSPLTTPADTPTMEKDQAEAEALGEAYRPGLGPMIRKRAVADKLKKAAFAASAFKPRPGGAAERILQAKMQREGEPDGISAVVPRPVVKRDDSNASTAASVVEPASPRRASKQSAPRVQITSPSSPRSGVFGERPAVDGENGVQLEDEQHRETQPGDASAEDAVDQQPLEERHFRQPQVKVKRRSAQQEKYLAELGIERSLIDGRGLEFERILSDFGWNDGVLQPKQLVDLEKDLKRELGRVEAGSWLSHNDPVREERVTQVENLLDRAIAECDELEGLLTLYSVELGSLNEDIAFIEAQSQGLQVQSANQKLLQIELQNLVDTMSLDKSVFEALRYGDLSSSIGVEEVEASLMKLYQAMVTMDPSIRSAALVKGKGGHDRGNELSRMAALRENKDVYQQESSQFCQRLVQHLDHTFTTALNLAKSQLMQAPPGSSVVRLNKDGFMLARTGLWMYSPLILFTKELTPSAWQTILQLYHSGAKPLYTDSFKENIAGWKRVAKKSTGDEADLLFTSQDKEGVESTGGGLTSTARKLTVKRSQTLAKTFRNASGEKASSPIGARNPGALSPSEVFAGCLDEMAPLISQEQNFIVDMFHATTLSSTDFIDASSSTPPDSRRGTNLLQPKPPEPDRDMARRVTSMMEEIFPVFTTEITSMLDWALSSDPIQGVGVLAALSKHSFYLAETSQEYLLHIMEQLSARLQTLWAKFVEDQVRAIEDTKVKIHKRKGVLKFMRVFPHFAAGVENTFAAVAKADYDGPSPSVIEVRNLVDDAYARINRAMFDSLKVIAKESPHAVGTVRHGGADDHEDKEMLNYQVLVIENMNHYVEEVDDGGKEGVLAEWRGRAMRERMEALEAYVQRVVRRPLGKLLDFLDSLDSLLLSSPHPSTLASRPAYSRKTTRTLLASYDSKEIRRGIDTLRKRIEKHFGDADDEAISRALVMIVCKECEQSYESVVERLERVIKEVWPPAEGEKEVEVEFTREDVRAGFRR